MKQVIKEDFAFEKLKEVGIMVSFRKLSICTISSSPQKKKRKKKKATTTTTKNREFPIQLERLQDFLNSTQIYKHCQISVTQMIMVELKCF